MFCEKCGKQIEDYETICPFCNAEVDDEVQVELASEKYVAENEEKQDKAIVPTGTALAVKSNKSLNTAFKILVAILCLISIIASTGVLIKQYPSMATKEAQWDKRINEEVREILAHSNKGVGFNCDLIEKGNGYRVLYYYKTYHYNGSDIYGLGWGNEAGTVESGYLILIENLRQDGNDPLTPIYDYAWCQSSRDTTTSDLKLLRGEDVQ